MDTLKRYYRLYPAIWDGYEVGELLGSGSFGDVYTLKRTDCPQAAEEAFKEIAVPPPSAGGLSEALFQGLDEAAARHYYEGMRQKALEEVALLQKFSACPQIVHIIDAKIYDLPEGHEDFGWVIFVRMEKLISLKQKVLHEGLSIKELCRLIIDLCSALELCHGEGIVHRDIKPENIFFSPELNTYKLGDFGIACYLNRMTEEKGQAGTLTHMAPEVYCGATFTCSSDLYAAGMILYKFLNENRVPLLPDYPQKYSPAQRNHAIQQRLHAHAIPLPSIVRKTSSQLISLLRVEDVSHEGVCQLAAIAAKAIDPECSKRYGSAAEFKSALQSWLRKYRTDLC